ncbi:heavy metal-associated isoprenylated plant protein 9-like isoform X2 [Lycium ferocissimum]|nr:heavy metal-associated isoprenylated plant protein 9-like isoform X2 [Lycium ferocissimum]
MIDMGQNQVTIKGMIEPQAVCERIVKKTNRVAKVLSPLPEAEGEPLPELVASRVSELRTIELTVNMHCEACAQQLKRTILKMRGVSTVETDLSLGKVIVKGSMDANKLVDYVYRRTKKQAKIGRQPETQKHTEEPKIEDPDPNPDEEAKKQDEEEKKEGGHDSSKASEGEEIINKLMYYCQPLYVTERIPPPYLFSDENPNACCIT